MMDLMRRATYKSKMLIDWICHLHGIRLAMAS